MTELQPYQQQVPDYLRERGAEGLEHTGDQVSLPPRLKVIQAQTDDELREQHGVGSVILMPDELLIAKAEESFTANLLFFWQAFQKWADLNDVSHDIPIIEETVDPRSEIARKALSRAIEPYGDGTDRKFEFVHCYNAAIKLANTGGWGIVSWSKGSHKLGRQLHSRLVALKAPVYAYRMTLTSERTQNASGQKYWWLRWRHDAWLPADELESARAIYETIAEQHKKVL